MSKLFNSRASIAFLVAVFLNSFVDLGHKIIIQNTIFKTYDGSNLIILTAIVNALILLPFILLFSPAGFISDRFAKHKVMRASAWVALSLTIGITVCYMLGWFWMAFAMTFLMGVQSTFYGPAKYAYIRGLFGKDNLAQANGVVAAISILSILAGTLLYSIVFESLYSEVLTSKKDIIQNLIPVGFLLVGNAVIELIMLYQLPQTDHPQSKAPFRWQDHLQPRTIISSLQPVINNSVIRLSILGLAMFWSVGQILLASFPAFIKQQTGEVNTIVIQAVMAASGLGIALGSYIAGRISRNYIETGLVPLGAAGITLGLWLLPGMTSKMGMALDFFFIGCMGGIFLVPLNALVQFTAREQQLGKVLAGSNLVQNVAMLSFLVLTAVAASAGFSAKHLLIITAALTLAASVYTVYKLPQSLVRFLMGRITSTRYRLNVQDMKKIPGEGGVMLLGNHISWIDWAIVQLASPRPVHFVMIKSIYDRWYLTWFFKMFGCIPIQQGAGSGKALERVSQLLNEGKVVCLFPEGTISRSGHLNTFKKGFELAATQCNDDVVIQPFYLRGLWGSQFSRSSDKLKKQPAGLRRDLVIAFGDTLPINSTADLVKRRVFDLSIRSWNTYVETLPTLSHAWIDSAKQRGGDIAIADSLTGTLSKTRALTGTVCFSRRITCQAQNVGLLLPNSAGGALANMASLMRGKTVVNLNYSASLDALKSAIEQAQIKTVYTSRKFIKKLVTRGIDLSTLEEQCKFIYLEDLKETIGKGESLLTLLSIKLLPAGLLKLLYCRNQNPNSTAAILFSSGSEGAPKGVMLSHLNFMANLKQITDVLNVREDDAMMASLPLFHAFGLTVTQFLPLIEGIPMVCHADPTDAVGVGKAVAKYRATIICGTSTFLRLYTRNKRVHPLMFDSLRMVIAGAEKLQDDVRQAFKLKFDCDILEGYGTTETTPVSSVNLPDSLDTDNWQVQQGSTRGTVGIPLPGTSFKIVDPETFEELPTGTDGMILTGGAQVMQGYLDNPEKTASVIKEIDNVRWYVTGDKGRLDAQGFLTIVDRYSRFAKLAGEMVSLSLVEAAIMKALAEDYPELEVVAVNLPDDKKGEKVVILSEVDIPLSDIRSKMAASGCSALMTPARIQVVESLPKLGSGKTDFPQAKQVALSGEQ
ncbi:MAG: acyl-[ACP]--phospholipid O-acyltransferase [Alteromonadaceae bacterium]|nr:MAG: acyl-[ACP]--phospholipid O-acyltransferase [Alteromonadaceae bacterium]